MGGISDLINSDYRDRLKKQKIKLRLTAVFALNDSDDPVLLKIKKIEGVSRRSEFPTASRDKFSIFHLSKVKVPVFERGQEFKEPFQFETIKPKIQVFVPEDAFIRLLNGEVFRYLEEKSALHKVGRPSSRVLELSFDLSPEGRRKMRSDYIANKGPFLGLE